MNSLYRTPCTPRDCTSYTLGGCQVKCERFVKYQAIKEVMKAEKEIKAQSFEQRAKGVDSIYKSERGNRHRVGQS